ncbi:hypothetical protein MA16_Dca002887 [Dendrobium catenatum]|uniref:Uncharacterized protein n=1 Tax=Dendrobium catenatum TaxID=906689 RepID=A0A2I0X8Z8_9ASPA|nr:hypothetical protein MA16_Dca002887 [Dendrobium catenatum]
MARSRILHDFHQISRPYPLSFSHQPIPYLPRPAESDVGVTGGHPPPYPNNKRHQQPDLAARRRPPRARTCTP